MKGHASHSSVAAAGCKTLGLLVCEGGLKIQSEIAAEGGIQLIVAGASVCAWLEEEVDYASPMTF
jgi:hypothetical protein